MAWVIQSVSEGPVCITDIGITLTKGQIRDLDLIGRANAERSADTKFMLMKGFVKTIRKDDEPDRPHDAGLIQKVHQVHQATEQLAQSNADQSEQIRKLEQQNDRLQQALKEQSDLTNRVLEEVKAFAEKDPLGIRTIKAAIENIKIERGAVEAEKAAAPAELSERELQAHQRMLEIKGKKLEKNYKDLGKTVSKSASEDVQSALDAMDKLGI
jgi:hypothetical protein